MVKFLIGGSPRTHWSIAQSKARETEPEGIGWERVRIEPHLMDLMDLQGKVATPKGTVIFRYEKTGGTWHYFVELPVGMEATFVYPDGKKECLYAGKSQLQY